MDEATQRKDHWFSFPQLENSRSRFILGLFDSKVKFWESGYSCHLLTIELISERGYEVTFLLLLRLGDGGQGGAVGEKQNDHLNVILFKVEEAKTSGCSEGK